MEKLLNETTTTKREPCFWKVEKGSLFFRTLQFTPELIVIPGWLIILIKLSDGPMLLFTTLYQMIKRSAVKFRASVVGRWRERCDNDRLSEFGLNVVVFFQVVRMLISIVLVYIICWGPLLTFNLLQSFGYINTFLLGTEKYLKTAFSLMAYFNRLVHSYTFQ